MGILKDFRDFAMRGNVVDMAVGIIIGGAFLKIVTSLVNDIIMPPIGLLLGNVDFAGWSLTLREAVKDEKTHAVISQAVTLKVGSFINTVVDFLIVAFVKQMNRLKKEPPKEITDKDCPMCCTRIPIKAIRCPHCTSELV
jgi:large conductance mechanosensitive channel